MASQKKKSPTQAQVMKVYETLSTLYPNTNTELTYDSPFQLLVAVVLSAQCTDAQVNRTTPALFKRFPTAKKLAAAAQSDVETLIRSCGFYRQKAKAIISASKDLTEKFKGEVPNRMEDLTSLAGVGRKTASVVMNQAFDLPAIAVDTHVKRVSNRLGWSHTAHPEKIERELCALLPPSHWGRVNGMLILHGRRICKARKPLCQQCPVLECCPFGKTQLPI